MILKQISLIFTIGLLCFHTPTLYAQNSKVVRIEQADVIQYNQKVVANAERALGDVILTHEDVVMYCDSLWKYTTSNTVDAFGNVHIVRGDTLHMYADFLHYNSDLKFATVWGDVILKDNQLTLYTDSLDYDMNNNVGYYPNHGTIVDSTNVLMSDIGHYYANENTMIFSSNVRVVNEEYTIFSDTLGYNTINEVIEIDAATRVFGNNAYLFSEKGWFNTQTNNSNLTKSAYVERENTRLEADTILYNGTTAEGKAFSNVIINDIENYMIISGDYAIYNDFSKDATVSDSALFIVYQEVDTLFMNAEKFTTAVDTSSQDQKIVKGYYDVRFYREMIQGDCDSVIFYTADSTVEFHLDPIIWSKENQLSANVIRMRNESEVSSKVYMDANSFILQKVDSTIFNQIKGREMVGFIRNKTLDKISVNGNGQTIYYPFDEVGAMGRNMAESSKIEFILKENKINTIKFIDKPTGYMDPLSFMNDSENLKGFNPRYDLRPADKFDIFPRDSVNNGQRNFPKLNTPTAFLAQKAQIIDSLRIDEVRFEAERFLDGNQTIKTSKDTLQAPLIKANETLLKTDKNKKNDQIIIVPEEATKPDRRQKAVLRPEVIKEQ